MKVYILALHSGNCADIIAVFDSYEKALKSKEEFQGTRTGTSAEVFFILEKDVL